MSYKSIDESKIPAEQTNQKAGRARRARPASGVSSDEGAKGTFPTIVMGKCDCGKPLPSPSAQRCSKACSKARDKRRSGKEPTRRTIPPTKRSRFTYSPIGVDGEGEDGRYTLLAASDGEEFSRYIEDREGLDTERCLRFLLSLPPKPFVFGFGFSYDVNMILCSLTHDELFTLAQWGRVFWKEWRIAHVPGKALTVTHRASKRTCIVWDLYPWIQTSFVRMLEEFELADESTLERIATMKDQRSDFANVSMNLIRTYCLEECRLLSNAVKMLLDLIVKSGYKTNVFYSPGSLSAAVMKVHKVNDYRLEGEGGVLREAIEEGYVGARAEVAQVGPIPGPLYESDINSAYPAATAELPCFAHGVWRKYRRGREITNTTLIRVKWKTKPGVLWGPFPVRPRVGSLRFPTSGEAWIWGREARIGESVCKEFEILGGWEWVPKCDHRPFAYVAEIYDRRRELKDEGSPLEYVYKLILNSTYGKIAQRPYSGGEDPTWRYMPWAGLITSTVRAILMEQIVAVGQSHVILCATDCLITDKPLKVPVGPELGAWSVHEYEELFIAGPGFYEAKQKDAPPKVRNRGISRINVEFEELRAAWERDGREGQVEIHTRRFIGYRQALQYKETTPLWRQFVDVPMLKTMTLEPRREWKTDDTSNGRSKPPSEDYIRRSEIDDIMSKVLMQRVASNEKEDLVRRIVAADEISRRSLFDAAEQPDWLIDEFQSG